MSTRVLVLWGLLVLITGWADSQKMATRYALNAVEVPAAVQREPAAKPWAGPEKGPVTGLQEMARERGGAIWLGSPEGAARFQPKAKHPWERWQYFWGKRWLADNVVKNIIVEEGSGVPTIWIRTATGVTRLQWKPMTLAEKAQYFDERVEARHVRHGLVTGSELHVPGDVRSNALRDDDNDGLWTSMYLGAQAWRFKATGDPDARKKAQRAFRAILKLEAITGVPGFYARSYKTKHEPAPHGGEWHPTPDGEWVWKGDTSSDESVGHYYAYALYYDLVADEAEKSQIRAVVSRMTDYLIKNDYDMPDLDGQPTRWGQWSEKYLATEEGKYEAALRSLELLSFLRTTEHITGNPKYEEAYQDRVARGYAKNVRYYRRWDGGGEINFSDDELAYLSYEPLLRYEKDPKLRELYLDSLRFTWTQIRSDRNPLWNYMTAAGGAIKMTKDVLEESRMTLERFPMDMITWNVKNSHRLDVNFQKELSRQGDRQLTVALAPDERPIEKWNSNPYVPDGGGSGGGEDDGTTYLLPYWMGRAYGWVR